jgi:murein DD-endopeptidase MepM/ murein hydrolase activator NlpD
MVVIRHDDQTVSIYAHQRRTKVSVNDKLAAGDTIGEVGDTGSAKGAPHLHFGVQVNGKDVDPGTLGLKMEGDVPTFDDVPEDHKFYADIEWMVDAELTSPEGVNDSGNFYPDGTLTRGQLAAFLHRYDRYSDGK